MVRDKGLMDKGKRQADALGRDSSEDCSDQWFCWNLLLLQVAAQQRI